MGINDNKKISVKVESSKEFYFNFIQMFKQQLKITSLTDINVLTNFCLNMDYNSTMVKLPTSRRKQICVEMGIRNSHLSNSIKRLVDVGLIIGSDGEYEVNPFLAWKGSLKERERLLATKGVEIRVKFSKTSPELPYDPFKGGSKEFDK